MPETRRRARLSRAVVVVTLVLAVVGCSPPPVLTKAELDAKKLPRSHPQLTAAQGEHCRGCHKEQRVVRQQ